MFTQPFLVYLSKAAQFALADSSASTMGTLLKAMAGPMLGDKQISPIVDIFSKNFVQPDKIVLHTGSGVKISLDIRNVLPFKTIASLAS